MLSWLVKVICLLPRRCKGIPHTFSVYESDPIELWAVMRSFLNDRNGSFVNTFSRLPVRAHYVEYDLLSHSEQDQIINRAVEFVKHWVVTNDYSGDLELMELFMDPVSNDQIDDLLKNPPRELFPKSKCPFTVRLY
jgi:hypothetical protein